MNGHRLRVCPFILICLHTHHNKTKVEISSWMEGIKKAMNERNLNEGQWEDRKQWSLGVRQRRETF